ncbi:MAG: hypothetical protein JWO35_447 [Candidatus Saccharibacteria bacterium]|nr:hypothetical protein [Candidatus Saccharibacteria bacterium]
MAITQETPRGNQADLLASPQAPVLTDRGFLIKEPGDEYDTVAIYNDYYKKYTTYIVTPTDKYGIPYPIAPTKPLPPVRAQQECHHVRPVADLNHVFPKGEVLASKSPVLDERAKAALIGSRVQWSDYDQHHDVLHPNARGPRLPWTRTQLLTTLLLTNVGVVPEFGMDLSKPDMPIVRLSDWKRRWLWTSKQIHVMCDGDVTGYLQDEILEANSDHIARKDIENFLYSFDHDERIKTGFRIVSQLADRAIEPAETPYKHARKTGAFVMSHIGFRGRPIPQRASELTLAKLTTNGRAGPTLNALHTRFAQGERRPFAVYFEEKMAARAAA